MQKADLSIESLNIPGILELGSIFWMNLVSLEYLITNKTQKHGPECFTFREN